MSRQYHGQKRKLDDRETGPAGSWRGNHGQSHRSRPHPLKQTTSKIKSSIAPAVPSFGAPLAFTKGNPAAVAPPLEGSFDPLLPAPFAEDSASSDSPSDDEEEAAFRLASGGSLKFEYDGEIIVLETAEDIKAWFAERRHNFPTSSRIGMRAQERQARINERRRIEAETAIAMGYAPPPPSPRPVVQNARADQLRAQLLEQQKSRSAVADSMPGLGGYASSDSAEEDDKDDAPPEVHSSKTMPEAVVPPPTPRPPRPCKFYVQMGRCKLGARCSFAHVGPPALPKEREGRQRKTLYQRLLEQERAQENRLAVLAIKYLGDKGFFRPKE